MPDVTESSPEIVAVTGTVSGRVQGVGYRVSAEWWAHALGVLGWVRNLPDGRVEVFAQGRAHQVDEFARWLETGPPAARPDRVHLVPVPPDPALTSFRVRI